MDVLQLCVGGHASVPDMWYDSCPREFSMSLPCSFHTDVGMIMLHTHASNWGGPGVPGSLSDIDLSTVANGNVGQAPSPAATLVQVASSSQR